MIRVLLFVVTIFSIDVVHCSTSRPCQQTEKTLQIDKDGWNEALLKGNLYDENSGLIELLSNCVSRTLGIVIVG